MNALSFKHTLQSTYPIFCSPAPQVSDNMANLIWSCLYYSDFEDSTADRAPWSVVEALQKVR